MKDQLIAALRAGGHSVTPARLGLFTYLESREAVSVAECLADNPQLGDRASLYRTLALFRTLGVIEDVVISGRRLIELTDAFDRHHHHLSCTRCGRTVSINDSEIEQLINGIATQHHFQAQGHHLEITGLCQNCRNAS